MAVIKGLKYRTCASFQSSKRWFHNELPKWLPGSPASGRRGLPETGGFRFLAAMTEITLAIEGMSCNHCLNAVNRGLAKLPGVRIKSVAIGRAELEFDPGQGSPALIVAAIDDAGFKATPM